MKKLLSLIAAMLITVNAYALDLSITIGSTDMTINGEVNTIKAPIEENGMTLVPVRVITEAFGADVLWNDADQSVTVTKGDKKLWLAIDNINADLNGEKIELLTAPKLLDDTTMVPIRLISEMLNCRVTYNSETREINITDGVSKALDVPAGFSSYTKSPATIVYHNDDMTLQIEVSTYKKQLDDSYDKSVEAYTAQLKEKYKAITKTGERFDGNTQKRTISYYYDKNDIYLCGNVHIFFSGSVKYVLSTYSRADSIEAARENEKTLSECIENFKHTYYLGSLNYDYNESYIKEQQVNNHKFNIYDNWSIEQKDDVTSIIKDNINGFEITLDCIDYNTMNTTEQLEPYGLIKLEYKVYNAMNGTFKRVFNHKEGIPVPYNSHSNVPGYVTSNGIVVQRGPITSILCDFDYPEVINNFYDNDNVFVFDIDDRSIDFKNEINDKVKPSHLTRFGNYYNVKNDEYAKIVKDRICYVFCIDNTLMIADCKISNYYPYDYNRYVYDSIVRSFLKLKEV